MDHKNTDIQIIKNLYKLYKIFYSYSVLFPKKDKYALGAKCEPLSRKTNCISLLPCLYYHIQKRKTRRNICHTSCFEKFGQEARTKIPDPRAKEPKTKFRHYPRNKRP